MSFYDFKIISWIIQFLKWSSIFIANLLFWCFNEIIFFSWIILIDILLYISYFYLQDCLIDFLMKLLLLSWIRYFVVTVLTFIFVQVLFKVEQFVATGAISASLYPFYMNDNFLIKCRRLFLIEIQIQCSRPHYTP